LQGEAANSDIVAISGRRPWLRMRVGDFRVLVRPLTAEELADLETSATAGFLIARIIDRRDLDAAIQAL
jgi:hypothetical protein